MSLCQSCGMPLRHDPNQGGTNKDGSKNNEYCSFCYKDGAFTDDFQTPQEMQTFCVNKLKEMGCNRFFAWLFTRCIPRLKRWKK